MVSIILNVYNGEKYINKCLDSIINQTYEDIEILIVNDGSTDDTSKILSTYKDKRIRIINQENKGLSLSRNVGIDNAKGDYLYFVDVDDYIEKDTIEYLYNLSIKYDADLTTCIPLDRYDYETEIVNEEEKIEVLTNKEMLKRTLLIKHREGTTWNKLYRKKLFENIRFENRIINDVLTTYKLVLKANKIVYSNQIKYNYFHHNESIISTKKTNYMIDLYNAALERHKDIKRRYPKLVENDATLALLIVSMYFTNDEEFLDFLEDVDAKTKFKELFSLRIFRCDMRRNDKIKILLFKISPKLYNVITYKYLKMKRKI